MHVGDREATAGEVRALRRAIRTRQYLLMRESEPRISEGNVLFHARGRQGRDSKSGSAPRMHHHNDSRTRNCTITAGKSQLGVERNMAREAHSNSSSSAIVDAHSIPPPIM